MDFKVKFKITKIIHIHLAPKAALGGLAFLVAYLNIAVLYFSVIRVVNDTWGSRRSSLSINPQRSSNTRRTPAPSRRIFSPFLNPLFPTTSFLDSPFNPLFPTSFLDSHIFEASRIQSGAVCSSAAKFTLGPPPNSPQKHLCHFRSFHNSTFYEKL